MTSSRAFLLAVAACSLTACGGSTSSQTGTTSASGGSGGSASGAGGAIAHAGSGGASGSTATAGHAGTGALGGSGGAGGSGGSSATCMVAKSFACCSPDGVVGPWTCDDGTPVCAAGYSPGTSPCSGAGVGGAGGGAGSGGAGGAGGSGGCAGDPAGDCYDPSTCAPIPDDQYVCEGGAWECPSTAVEASACFCGGSTGQTCGAAMFCVWSDMHCGSNPGPAVAGFCQVIPDAASCPKNLDPVCGCLTQTYYDNLCLAHAAGEDAGPCMGGSGGSGQAGDSCDPKTPCAAGFFCEYPDALCGTGGPGACAAFPVNCGPATGAVCTCSGVVEPSDCAAIAKGEDVSLLGNCAAPAGTFACGDHVCQVSAEYCQVSPSDVASVASGYECLPVPEPCFSMNSLPTCGKCFADDPCGEGCVEDDAMNFTLTCPSK